MLDSFSNLKSQRDQSGIERELNGACNQIHVTLALHNTEIGEPGGRFQFQSEPEPSSKHSQLVCGPKTKLATALADAGRQLGATREQTQGAPIQATINASTVIIISCNTCFNATDINTKKWHLHHDGSHDCILNNMKFIVAYSQLKHHCWSGFDIEL